MRYATLIVEDVRNDGAFHLVRRVVRASRLNLVAFNVNARVRRRSTAVAGLGARLAQSAVGEGAQATHVRRRDNVWGVRARRRRRSREH